MPQIGRSAYVILAGVLLIFCQVAPVSALEREEILLHGQDRSYRIEAEIARTVQQRARGLMGRERLDENAGMLFVYAQEQPAEGAFWMYRTLIPLDIAFLGSDGEIRAIRTMSPCESERSSQCPIYIAGVPYHAALEVNAGYFARRGIDVGDTLELPAFD